MEDSHTHILSLPDDSEAAFFAVYDGHGGAKVAEYAGKHLHKYITKQTEYKEGNMVDAMQQAFLELDEAMLQEESLKIEQAGSTAVTILIKNDTLYCANVGDSRAIACINGHLEVLSLDHKPSNPLEKKRIMAAGGWVDCNRVNGNLALSRALGDFSFKNNRHKIAEEQIVTAFPDVEVRPITPEWEFIVMACDGIWDVLRNDEVLDFVWSHIGRGMEPEEICEQLMMRCLAPDCQMAGLGCDNMTVVIICFLHGNSYEELSKKCGCPREGRREYDILKLYGLSLNDEEE